MPLRRLRNRIDRALGAAWYAPRKTALATALLPLAALFVALSAVRRRLFSIGALPTRRVDRPVVVVGNLTAGGTGKTPLVRHLAEALRARGLRPGVVSRGHGGQVRMPVLVRAGDCAERVGDEPLLYATDGLPVAVGLDRLAAARLLIDRHPEIDVVIADDGLQHYRLARDVEIVVVDAVRGFGNGLPLPAGPLREPVSRLRHVDAIVVNRGACVATTPGLPPAPAVAAPEAAGARDAASFADASIRAAQSAAVPVFSMCLVAEAFWRIDAPTVRADPTAFRGTTVDAVAGIGHPERFFAMLAALGLRAPGRAFPDHHPFAARDFPADARVILMTEKDAVKCAAFADERFWAAPVRAQVDPPLAAFVEERLRGPQAARNSRLPGHQGPADLR